MRVEVSGWSAAGVAGGGVLLVVVLFWLGGEATRPVWREAGPIENVSATAYLLGMAVALLGALRTGGWKRAQFVMWAGFCLVFFGEETSWLQHYLNYSTPDLVKAHNAQGEFNLHNLYLFHGGKLLGESGASFAPGYLLKAQHLFQLGFLAYFLVLPVSVALARPLREVAGRICLPVPGWGFMAVIWIPILVSVGLTFAAAGQTKSAIAETREMFYSLSIALLVTRTYLLVGATARAGEQGHLHEPLS